MYGYHAKRIFGSYTDIFALCFLGARPFLGPGCRFFRYVLGVPLLFSLGIFMDGFAAQLYSMVFFGRFGCAGAFKYDIFWDTKLKVSGSAERSSCGLGTFWPSTFAFV